MTGNFSLVIVLRILNCFNGKSSAVFSDGRVRYCVPGKGRA